MELPKLREWEEKRVVRRGQTDRGQQNGRKERGRGNRDREEEGVGDNGANTLTTRRL